VIEVRRDPLAGHYRTLQTFTAEQEAHPLRFPHIAVRPSELL